MAQLSDIIKTLKENDKSQDETTEAIEELTAVFRKKFLAEERGRLDAIERRRESRRRIPAAPTVTGTLAAPMNVVDQIMDMLNRIAIPAVVGIGASMAGFDNFIRALAVPDIILDAQNALTKAADIIKAVGTFFSDIGKKIKAPVLKFTGAGGDLLKGGILKVPFVAPAFRFIDAAGKEIVDFLDYKIRLPSMEFFDKLPDFPKMPIGINDTLDSVRTFFFGAADAAGVRAGGVFGFFSKIAKFPGIRIVGGPVVQTVLTLIDGIMGFFRGFAQKTELVTIGSATFEKELSMQDRIFNGLEGAADGIIKGITDAFQTFFIGIPLWLSKNVLGIDLSNTALANVDLWNDFVKPIWNGIKGVFKFFFSADYRQDAIDELKANVFGPEGLIADLKNWFSEVFDFLPSVQGIKAALYNLLPDWMKDDADDIRKQIKAESDRLFRQEQIIRAAFGIPQGMPIDLGALPTYREFKAENNTRVGNKFGDSNVENRDLAFALLRAPDAAKKVNELTKDLAELTGLALGGKTSSRISKTLGQLVRIHPNELVVPLENTGEGRALKKLDKILNASNAELQMAQSINSSMSMAGTQPVIINQDNRQTNNSSTSDRRTYVATGAATDGFSLTQSVQ